MQRNDSLKIICQMSTPFGSAHRKGVMLEIMGVREVVDACQQVAKLPTVVDNAANRNAAKANATIAAFPPDQARPRALSNRALVSQRNFKCGIDRFGT